MTPQRLKSSHQSRDNLRSDSHEVIRLKGLKARARTEGRFLVVKLLLAAAIAFILFGCLFGLDSVRSNSMSPALKSGDLILYDRISSAYEKDDIVLVTDDEFGRVYARVVAAAGQVVDFNENGQMLVDGQIQDEPQIFYKSYRAEGDVVMPVTVQPGEVFVLGDQRTQAKDSRNFGAVSVSNVEGKVLAILFRWRGL